MTMLHRSAARVEELADVEMFSACSTKQLRMVSRVCDVVHFPAGTELMHEEEPGTDCYVLLDGHAAVRIGGRRIATVHPGEIVGEMALISDEPRVATVVTTTDARALHITPDGFTKLVDRAPAIARRVLRTLSKRLRSVQNAA